MAFAIDLDRLRAEAAKVASRLTQQTAGTDPYAPFTDRYEALRDAGLTDAHAFEIAEALCLRQERSDDRTVCALECRHFRRGYCMNHREAGAAPQLGELAFMLQRCPAFAAADVGGDHAE